jgi:hypothetical protein
MFDALEEAITKAEVEVEAARVTAEEAMENLLDVLGKGLREWLPGAVREKVQRDHRHLHALSEKSRTEMKQELSDMTAVLGKAVRGWLDRDRLWPHRLDYSRGETGFSYYGPASRTPDPLSKHWDEGLQDLLARYFRKYHFPYEHDRFEFDWTGAPSAAFCEYTNAVSSLSNATRTHGQAVEALSRAQAKSLWDET